MKNLVKILIFGNVSLLVWTTFRERSPEIEIYTESTRLKQQKNDSRKIESRKAKVSNQTKTVRLATKPSIKKDINIWEEQNLRRQRMALACQKFEEIKQLIKNASFRELLAFHQKIYNLEQENISPRFGKPRPWILYSQTSAIVYIQKENLGKL